MPDMGRSSSPISAAGNVLAGWKESSSQSRSTITSLGNIVPEMGMSLMRVSGVLEDFASNNNNDLALLGIHYDSESRHERLVPKCQYLKGDQQFKNNPLKKI